MGRSVRVVLIAASVVAACRDAPRPVAPPEPSLAVSSAGVSSWTLIYRNFGPDLTFDTNPYSAWTINGFLGSNIGQQAIAQRVTPGSDFALREVRLAVTHFSGLDSLRVNVQRDSAGKPGPVLETVAIGGWSPLIPTVAVARSRILPVLPRGVPVWISLTAGGSGVVSGWNWNSIGDVSSGGNMAATQGGSTSGPWGIGPSATRGAMQLNGSAPAYGLKPVTVDSVSILPGGSLVIDGTPWYYHVTLSNRTTTPRANVALQGWIEQGSPRRAVGGQLLTCSSTPGALPFGTCLQPVNPLAVRNTGGGSGTLVAGPAWFVASIVQLTTGASTTLASRAIPVTLSDVQVPPVVLGVTLTPTDTTFTQIGVTAQLTATVQAIGGASTAVTWSSSNPTVAAVSSTGRVTVVAQGGAFITATSVADPTKRASMLVSVLSAPAVGIGMQVAPGMPIMQVGQQLTMAAQVPGDSSGPASVLWSSSNAAVAVVSATGVVTAVSPGAALILAVSRTNNSKSAGALVSVGETPALGLGVNVSPGLPVRQVGSQFTMAAQVIGGTSSGFGSVTWASTNTTVAVVSATGLVTTVGEGSALIFGTLVSDPSKSAAALLSVGTTPTLGQGVNLSPGRLDLVPGGTARLSAQVVGGASGALAVNWSSNGGGAFVDAFGGVVGALPGSAVITAVSKADPSRSASVVVTVHDLAFSLPAMPVSISTGAFNPPANPTSLTLAVVTTGPTGVFIPPYSSVEFFASNGGTLVSLGTGSMTITDNGQVRTVTYSLNWSPGTAFGTGLQRVVAKAYGVSGWSVTTLPNTLITLTDP